MNGTPETRSSGSRRRLRNFNRATQYVLDVQRVMTKKLDEIHPGETFVEEFIKPMGITIVRLASDIDVPTSCISEIGAETLEIQLETKGGFHRLDIIL